MQVVLTIQSGWIFTLMDKGNMIFYLRQIFVVLAFMLPFSMTIAGDTISHKVVIKTTTAFFNPNAPEEPYTRQLIARILILKFASHDLNIVTLYTLKR